MMNLQYSYDLIVVRRIHAGEHRSAIAGDLQESKGQIGRTGFTLLEVLVVIGIVSVLLALLIPGLSHAREKGKQSHCLARLKDIGSGTAVYAEGHGGRLPPAAIDWHPTIRRILQNMAGGDRCNLTIAFGWGELLYEDSNPNATVADAALFPAQRNYENHYGGYFNCPSATTLATHGAHLRVYLPGWAPRAYALDLDGRFTRNRDVYDPICFSPMTSDLVPRMPIVGDSNEFSDQGDYLGFAGLVPCFHDACPNKETSIIATEQTIEGLDFNEANQQDTICHGGLRVTNRFEERHVRGANYLFADFHGEWSTDLRHKLGCDWNLDGTDDPPNAYSRERSGCPPRSP